ncbi:MAG: hypothetical protein DSY70_08480 [Desulfobulbus sp.]|nr:MAG: hypothetical protein DSY70_08480 [Desulfobulbus sp.]
MKKYFDAASLAVIVITFVLFVFALVAKGITHDLLLEAGVFLVSVKLIMMGYKNSQDHERILSQLRAVSPNIKGPGRE